tara:strand:- start:6818 stop:7456 length:639 start_codon:yes stop_codon:yes gene_type:complete
MNYVIPARRNSKGLPFKNRKLIEYTLQQIPPEEKHKIFITTDDEFIIDKLKLKYNIIKRPDNLSTDDIDIRSVMEHALGKIQNSDDVVMLYLTYPQRTWNDIQNCIKFFKNSGSSSLLCKKDIKQHPYLCMFSKEGNKGRQIIPHDLYRRQDYPECFQISHFMCIFKQSELNMLNKNMYNSDTTYYSIGRVIDVDTSQDLKSFEENNGQNNS